MTMLQVLAARQAGAMMLSSHGLWPSHAQVTRGEVSVAGQPLSKLARAHGTPLVRIGPPADARTTPSSSERQVTALVTAIERVDRDSHGRLHQIWVDANLGGCHPRLGETRLIGRRSASRRRRVSLCPEAPTAIGKSLVRLPTDLRVGDLLAIPCEGAVALVDVRPMIGARPQEGPDSLSSVPHCLK